MNKTEKRRSLCIEAINAPSVFLGTTPMGWLLGIPAAYLAWKLIDLEAAITIGFTLWLAPRLIAKNYPHIVTAFLRNLWFSRIYDAS